MKDYRILEEDKKDVFMMKLNAWAVDGWELVGPVVFHPNPVGRGIYIATVSREVHP